MPLSRINWVARPLVKFAAAPGNELSQEAAAALPETGGNDSSADPGQDIPGTDVAVRTEAAVSAKEQPTAAEVKVAAQEEHEQLIQAANQKTANNSFECIKAMLLSEKTRKDQLKSTLERDIEVTNMSIRENREAYSKLERQVAPQTQPQSHMLSPDQTMFLNAGQGMNRSAQFVQAMATPAPAASGLAAAAVAAVPAPAPRAAPAQMQAAQGMQTDRGQRPNEQFPAGGRGQAFGYQSAVSSQFLPGYMPNADMQQHGIQQDASYHMGRAAAPEMTQQQTPFHNMMAGQSQVPQAPASTAAPVQFPVPAGHGFTWNQIQSQNQSSFTLQGQTLAAMGGSQFRSDTSYQQAQMLNNSAQPQYSSAPGQNDGSQSQPQPVNFGGNAAQPYQNQYQSLDNSYQGQNQNHQYRSRSQNNRYQNQSQDNAGQGQNQNNSYREREQNNWYQNQSQNNSYQNRSQTNQYQELSQFQGNSYQSQDHNNSYWGNRYQNQQDNSYQGRYQNNRYQNQSRFNQLYADVNGADAGNMTPAVGASLQMRVDADLYILQSDHVGYLNDMLMFLQSKNIHFAFFDADRAYQPQDIVLLPNNYQIPDLNCRVFFYHEFNKKDLWAFLKDTLGQRGFKLN